MNIRNFLELQCTFKRNWELDTTTSVERILCVPKILCNDLSLCGKLLSPTLDRVWNFLQSIAIAVKLFLGECLTLPSHLQRKHEEGHDLACKRLCGSNTNLWT